MKEKDIIAFWELHKQWKRRTSIIIALIVMTIALSIGLTLALLAVFGPK